MLKMTIDNEEVVSKNNFTIKEEMLSPSSTILNNTYPKSWEDDKNYTSRFYYPKDYAKLDIQNFSITPEEAGTTIDIVGSATLTDVDTTKESRVLSLKGQTSQTTYSGKNLFVNNFTQTTVNGITITPNSDGSITINGTSTSSGTTDIYSIGTATTYVPISISDGTYTLSGSGNNNCLILAVLRNSSSQNTIITSGATASTYQNITGIVSARLFIRISAGASFTNFKIYPQLEKSSTATSFEKYVGGTASPNPSYPQPVNVVSGDNYINICGKNLFNKDNSQIGKAWNNASASNRAIVITKVEPNTTYNISYQDKSGVDGIYFFGRTNENDSTTSIGTTGITSSPRQVITTANTNYLGIQLNKENVSQSDIDNVGIQIEKGNATTYEPYIGNSYPIYLGVENLYKESEATLGTISQSDGTTISSSTSVYYTPSYIGILPNTKYSFKYNGTSNITIRVFYYSNTRAYLGTAVVSGSSSNEASFTTNASAYFIRLQFGSGFYNQNLQFTKGEKIQYISNSPIELCKIGDYQDYIYKENKKWYKYSAIGKVVLKGTENWIRSGNTSDNFFCGALAGVSIPFEAKMGTAADSKCDYFVKGNKASNSEVFDMYNGTEYYTTFALYLSTSKATDVATFKTWLVNHNTTFYYVLNTPTTTLITDTTLLEQLDALESQ